MNAEQIFVSSQLRNVANEFDLTELPNALAAIGILPEEEAQSILAENNTKKARRAARG